MGELAGGALPPLAAHEWGDAEYAAFGALLGVPGEKVPRAGSGHRFDPLAFDVIGVMARHPELARHFLRFNGYLAQRGELDVRARELAILRVAARRRSAYEWAEHADSAGEAGISAAEIEAAAAGPGGFDGDDRLVLEATDQLLDEGRIAPGTWADLCERLGLHPAMELIFVVGSYSLLATAFATWGLEPRPGSPELPPVD